MAWVYLVLASFGEIFGVASINMYLKRKSWIWLITLVAVFSFGFYFLGLAMRDIPLGTAYAIWTGLGATGAVIMGVVFFKESMSVVRALFLTCIICGAVGLRIVS
ncbi:DMT family transporter [Oceanobacillus sp. FSL H7-0719]|uniref:DMT family transporter n=1 Tax=Oceanobacillus sp. FSL H7-0719 TaxID=2954507 RepID=UPI003247264E